MHYAEELEHIIATLKKFLPQYLSEFDIDTSKNFKCINPKHEDKVPSMSCKQNEQNAWCFACGVTCDIFQAAHWLEGRPISGPGFIEENVLYLADKFGIEVQRKELTEEELYRQRIYRAYHDAALLVLNNEFGDYSKLKKEVKKRKWGEAVYQKIGTVDYKQFRNALKDMGYEPRFQDEIDLGRPDIFNTENMIFVIRDERGRPVGFAARNLEYNGNGRKYTNQKTTGLRCNIYQKGKRLYEIHTAIKHTPPLYIFEGYTDVITAQMAGLMNCCAIGGTAFTEQHVDLLRMLGQNHLVLVLDGDEAGRNKTMSLIDKFLQGKRDMTIEVVDLPDGKDPDDFIRENGLDAFLGLKRFSAFEWRLNLFDDNDDDIEICNVMIPIIANEPSRIMQDKMCNTLAKFTGIEKKIIQSELQRILDAKEDQKLKEKEIIVDRMVHEIKRNPSDAKTLLYEYASKIEQIDTKYDSDKLSIESCIQWVQGQKKTEEEMSGEFAGFYLRENGLGALQDILDGNWREDVFCAIGGKSNAGKSSLVSQLAYEIASDERNDACVIFHTIDDSKEQILPRLVCQAYGDISLTLNEVRNPNYFVKKLNDPSILEKRKIGYDKIIKLMKEGRLLLKDASDGASFAFGSMLVKHYRQKFPDRNIVYILDNLHKIPDFDSLDIRVKFKTISNQMKELATKYHVAIVATVEYTKMEAGVIPTNNNIAETRAIIYDSNFIAHLYNDLHERGINAICVHKHDGELLPRIRLGIGKNKISAFKGRLFLDFYPSSSIFRRVDTTIAEVEMKKRMLELKESTKVMQGEISFSQDEEE